MPPELSRLLRRIRRFNQERDWEKYHSPKNLVMGLMIEAAELAEHFLWLESGESRSLPPKKLKLLKDEIGDVVIHLLNLCDALGIDPVTAAGSKLEQNRKKYPAERVRGKALKYTEYTVTRS
jgi:NTP pyrophosphatase (non-canonical NTP hydrolase)